MLLSKNQPYLSKMRCRYLSYIIPLGSVLALLLLSGAMVDPPMSDQEVVYATTSDSVSPRSTDQVSLSLSSNKASTDAVQGTVALASIEVSVEISRVEDYSMIFSVEEADLVNGSTVVKAGNAVDNNTWGYYWGEGATASGTYTAPSVNGNTLTTPELDDNGNISFTRNLVFAANFANNATSGTYGTNGKISLAVTPKTVVAGVWSTGEDAGVTTMQEMTNEICNQVPTPSKDATVLPTLTLYDKRDNETYDISKMPDGNCWMVQNLRYEIQEGREISKVDSDIRTSWTPTADEVTQTGAVPVGFDSSDISEVMSWKRDDRYGVYYNWMAATAKSGSGITSTDAMSSICPKHWVLPTRTDYGTLFTAAGIGNNSTGSEKIQNSAYRFLAGGHALEDDLVNIDNGYYWTSLAYDSTSAIGPTFTSDAVGLFASGRYAGFTVRCMLGDTRTLDDIDELQDMTVTICDNTIISDKQYLLKDIRDGTQYSVAKLKDGRCWMTENLRLTKESMNANGVTQLTSANSDVASNTTLPASSKTGFNSNEGKNVFYDNNPSYGAYYTWCMATAGCSTANGNARWSVCPYGWKLPTSDEYAGLLTAAGLSSNAASVKLLKQAPYKFTAGGWMYNSAYGNSDDVYGTYWSSTVASGSNVYILNFNNSVIAPDNTAARSLGGNVRCVAKE